MEEKLSASAGTSATLEAQVDQLQQDNQHLKDTLEHYQKEKEEANQRIAALDSSNEENKNKVTFQVTQIVHLLTFECEGTSYFLTENLIFQILSMELSHKDLQEKINRLNQEKARLVHQLQDGSSEGVIDELIREKDELEERLSKEKEAQVTEYQAKTRDLLKQLHDLTEIR